MGDKSLSLQCDRHGASYATYVCGHVAKGQGLGFVESDNEDNDPRPDAWCSECDKVLMQEGEWNDKAEAFANIQFLCANCYDEVRRRNLTAVDGVENGINKVWFLDNVIDLHDDYPETFEIPGEERRRSIKCGDYVKLIFLLAGSEESDELVGERMWVKVTKIDHVGYFGDLDSVPHTPGSISLGEKVLFGPEHVVDLIPANLEQGMARGADKIVDHRHNSPNASGNKARDSKAWDD